MKNIITLLFTLLPFLLPAQEADKDMKRDFTLEEAIEFALVNQDQMKLEQLNLADAEKQIFEYKTTGIPTVQFNGNYQHFIDIPTQLAPSFLDPNAGFTAFQFGLKNNVNLGVDVNALIFDGSFFVGLKAQQMFRDLTQRQLNVTAYNVGNQVEKAYLAALVTERNIGILDENIKSLEELLAETRETYKAGFVEKLDVDRLMLTLDNLQIERDNIARLLDLNYNLLKFQMGYPITEEIVLTDNFDELTAREWAREIVYDEPIDYTLRPEYAVIEKGQQLQEANMKMIKASYLPVLRGFFSYSEQLQAQDIFDAQFPFFPATIAGLTISMPIFDGLNRSARIQRAKIELDKIDVQRDQFITGMELEVQNARIALKNAFQTMEARKRSLELSKEILRTAEIKYREGVGSSLELNQANSDMLTAQGNYIQALYDLVVAKTDLDHALGK